MHKLQSATHKNMRALLVLLVLVCWLSLTGICRAQGTEAPANAPKPADPKPIGVSVPQIPNQALDLASRINEIQKKIADQRIEDDTRQSLTDTMASIGSLETKLQNLLYGLYTPKDLTILRKRFEELNDRLVAMDGKLRKRAENFESWIGEVRKQIEVWQLTQAAAKNTQAPQFILDQVAKTLEKLNSTEQNLETSRNKFVDLEGQIVAQQAHVQRALENLEEARSNLVAEFFGRQAIPLWKADLTSGDFAQGLNRTQQTLHDFSSEIRDYLTRSLSLVVFQFLIIVALALAMQRVRSSRERSKGEIAEGKPAEENSHVDMMDYPWNSSLLIGLSLTPTLQPTAPNGIHFVFGLIWVIVWLRVLNLLLPSRHAPLYGFAALACMVFARDLSSGAQLLYRLLLIGELGLGLSGTVWLKKSKWLEHIQSLQKNSLWYSFLKVWQNLVIAALSCGLLGVIWGYLSLGDRVAILFIEGSFYGAAFFAGVRILEDIVACALAAGPISRLDLIRRQEERFLAATRSLIRALGFSIWIYLMLESVALWAPLVNSISTMLAARLGYGSITFSVGGLLAFGLTLWISWLLARLVSLSLYHGVFIRLSLQSGVLYALASFFRYLIITLGFLVAIGNLGLSLDRITLMISALGVGIGFGLQNIAKDIISGAVLLFERPMRVGDCVEIENLLGVVTRKGVRASTVRTRDGAEVLVPNGELVSGRVTNWTLSDSRHRIKVEVGVAYGTDPEKVLDILMKAAQSHPEVLNTPAPKAHFRGFGDGSLNFELRIWTQSTLGGWQAALKSDLTVAINKALAENGIEIPFPQRDLHLRSILPELRESLTESTRAEHRGEHRQGRQEFDSESPKQREEEESEGTGTP